MGGDLMHRQFITEHMGVVAGEIRDYAVYHDPQLDVLIYMVTTKTGEKKRYSITVRDHEEWEGHSLRKMTRTFSKPKPQGTMTGRYRRTERCPSTFVAVGDSQDAKVRCSLEKDHAGLHEGYHHEYDMLISWEGEPKELPVETVTENPIGWRAWRLVRRHPDMVPLLASLIGAAPLWDRPTMTVHHRKDGEGLRTVASEHAPILGSKLRVRGDEDHGIYSYKRPLDLTQKLSSIGPAPRMNVVGKVENSGDIVEHQLGYRAQIVSVRELWLIEPNEHTNHSPPGIGPPAVDIEDDDVESLSRRFDCPVHLLRHEQVYWWASYFQNDEEKKDG